MRSTLRSFSTGLALAALMLAGSVAQCAVGRYFTCVGGASGMTLDLNPYKGIVRGCAPQMMDVCLKNKRMNPNTGVPQRAYCVARIKSSDPTYSEPNAETAPWGPTQVKFTGDKKDVEIEFCEMENGDVWYAIVIRADSVLGLRYVVNRQFIYDFTKCSGSTDGWKFTLCNDGTTKSDASANSIFQLVEADINAKIAAGGIPIEGGLAECFIDSGIDAIAKYNSMFPAGSNEVSQPGLSPENLKNTKDNLLAIAVMAVIYNEYIEEWNGNQPVNITQQMMRMIEGGMVDTWDYFFSSAKDESASRKLITNYFREALSGTGISYLGLVQRGVDTAPNGAQMSEYYDFGDFDLARSPGWYPVANCASGANYHRSGIPGLTCVAMPYPSKKIGSSYVYDSAGECVDYNPGGGVVNKAVQHNYGGIGYTFLQKFTKANGMAPAGLNHIRIAKFNGETPFEFDPSSPAGNSLPGVNGVPDVTTTPGGGRSYYQSVVDGRYPLWTYNHCFDATNGQSTNLAEFVEKFTNVNYEQYVRDVGLLHLNDMDAYAVYRSIPGSGPNAGRGKGLGRGGFLSPRTDEIVRDGMMMVPKDQNARDKDGNPDLRKLPAEGYPEMRP